MESQKSIWFLQSSYKTIQKSSCYAQAKDNAQIAIFRFWEIEILTRKHDKRAKKHEKTMALGKFHFR